LGVVDQFRGLRPHPILCLLISFCEDPLRTLFTRPLWPPSMNWSSELLLRPKHTADAGEHLEGNWIPLGHLTCHERRACSSCLALYNIDSIGNSIFFSYTFILHKQFYFVASGLKIIGPDSNLESPCIL
jgi:hypothetical protein